MHLDAIRIGRERFGWYNSGVPGRIDGREDQEINSLEALSPQDALRSFFGWAEQAHPEGVASLVSTVTSLIPRGEKPLTEYDVRNGLTEMNCDVGLKLFSHWLDEIGVGGFRQLGLFDKGKVVAAKALLKSQGIQLPSADRVTDPESQAVLRTFSSAMRRFSQESLGAKAPFGLLLSESIGSHLSSRGSRQLRTALEQSLQGHFDWLRNALGVRDVAQNPNFIPLVAPEPTPPAEDLASTKPRPAIKREAARTALEENDQWTLEAQGRGFEVRGAVLNYQTDASPSHLVAVLQTFSQYNHAVFVDRPDRLSDDTVRQGESEYEELLHASFTGEPFEASLDKFDVSRQISSEEFNQRAQFFVQQTIRRMKDVQDSPSWEESWWRLQHAKRATETLIDLGYLVFAHMPPELKDNAPAYQAYYQKLIDAAVEVLKGID